MADTTAAASDRRRLERRTNPTLAELTLPELRRMLVTTILLVIVLVLFLWMVRTVIIAAILGVIVGAAADPFIQQALPGGISANWPQWASPVALGIIGFLQGTERASSLKIQAQMALCQMQIEINTRQNAKPPEKTA